MQQPEAEGLPAEERAHSRTLWAMSGGGSGVEAIAGTERWHSMSRGGGLRAAVFGINDGLVSNFSLVMGFAGAEARPEYILLAGVAGLLAGSFSMAAGEYVSVSAQRELFEQQIAMEKQELEMSPKEEEEELALIYQAKGIPEDQARALARRIIANPKTAIDTLAREELGLDPAQLGSPWTAAGSSFVAFIIGAFVPVLPYLFTSGAHGMGHQRLCELPGAVRCRRADFDLYRPRPVLKRPAYARHRTPRLGDYLQCRLAARCVGCGVMSAEY